MKHRTFWGVLGVIIFVFGFLWTLFIALQGGKYLYWLVLTGGGIIAGILLIAWVFGENE